MSKKFILILLIIMTVCFIVSIIANLASYCLIEAALSCTKATDLMDLYAKVSTPVFAILGLLLGFLYFYSRYHFDSLNISKEKKNNRLQLLIGWLKEADDLVLQLFSLDGIDNDSKLGHLREKIIRSFDHVETLLDSNLEIINFDRPEMFIILNVNSIVDKNENIMRQSLEDLTSDSFNDVRDKYQSSMKNALRVCYGRFE